MGVSFTVVPSNFDEYLDHSLPAAELTSLLALGKARAVAALYPEALVIGSDTLVTLNNQHLGKAIDLAAARAALQAQAGQEVVVTTSVVLLCTSLGLEEVHADATQVLFLPANHRNIETYLQTGDWKDKAGSWGLQSGAASLVEHMSGAYDTVLGLPTDILAGLLQKQGVPAQTVHLTPPIPTL